MFGLGNAASGPPDPRLLRRRRAFRSAILVGAAIVLIALCAGSLAVTKAITNARERASTARDTRMQREQECLDLEQRLNRLTPPGATTNPVARAAAIRDEDSAVRLYLGRLSVRSTQEAWQQLLGARATYADALAQPGGAPAFFVAPKDPDGTEIATRLTDATPSACAGPIRRLAAPDL